MWNSNVGSCFESRDRRRAPVRDPPRATSNMLSNTFVHVVLRLLFHVVPVCWPIAAGRPTL